MAILQGRIFNRQGVQLAEIAPDWHGMSWRLNHVGMCQFTLAWSDPACTRDNLRWGNRLLVEFDNGLPYWGGVIDPPRAVRKGSVTVTAYTGERLLDWRVTAKGRYFSGQQPGHIFSALLNEESGEYPTGVTVGEVYAGGVGRSIEYHYHDLLGRVQDLAKLTGMDFAVFPVVTNNVLGFQARWFWRRGADRRNAVWLLDGANVMDPALEAQGTLANRVIVAGEGTTWGDDRAVGIAEDPASMSLYGYREYAEVQSGVKVQDTLDANAAAILAAKKDPVNMITVQAANVAPGTFGSFGVGDIVTAQLFVDSSEWYYQGPVRVVAREWSPGEVCRLEVQEWND